MKRSIILNEVKKSLLNNEGTALIIFIVFMPVMLSVMGLAIDGGIYFLSQIKLEMATEAASLSALSTYDEDIWNNAGIVIFDELEFKISSEKYLKANYPEAEIVLVHIGPENEATVKSRVKYEYCFLKIFGMTETYLYSECKTIGG